MEKTIVDNYKLKIEVLSCVHIGSGNEFYPYECFFEVDGNPPKFITFNINRFLLDHPQDALKIFMDGSPVIKPLWKYEGIKKYLTQRIYKDTICQISRDNINEIMNIWENQRKVSVFQFIKTTDNNAYIPGSSLKGFIRTALAYYFLKNGWAKLTQDRQAIENIFRDDGEINKDLFRLWSISDSQTPSYNTAIIQAKVLSKGLIRNDLRNFYEVLLPTTTLRTTFNFLAYLSPADTRNYFRNNKVYQYFPKDIKKLFTVINLFSRDIIANELDYYKKSGFHSSLKDEIISFYNDLNHQFEEGTALLPLGRETGKISKTIELFRKKEMPISRDVIVKSRSKVFGWIKLSLE